MQSWEAQTIVSVLETTTPTRVFAVWESDLAKLSIDTASWPVPSLALVRGTALGAADFAIYAGPLASSRVSVRDGEFVPVPREQWRSMKAEEQIDAVLYLGPSDAMISRRSHEVPPALCVEPGFLESQLTRIAVTGVPRVEGERLEEYCATVGSR